MIRECLKVLCTILLIVTAGWSVSDADWKRHIELLDSLSRARNLDSALTVANIALTQVEREFGPDDTLTAKVMYKMAVCYVRMGNYAEAEPIFGRVLEVYENRFGSSHPSVGKILNTLAVVYKYQGKYDKAEQVYHRSLKIVEQSLGQDHPDVATALRNLAALYVTQKRFAEAGKLLERALAIRENSLRPDDPKIARILTSLGDVYREQNRYADARSLFRRALKIQQQELEPGHPDMALALTDLANLHHDCGQYKQAGPLYERALAIWKKSDDPDMEVGLYNLAMNYYEQGDYYHAEPLFHEALETIQHRLGPDHPDLIHDLNTMANLYAELGKFEKAELFYRRSLELAESAFGTDSEDAALILNNLAYFYMQQARYEEAAPLLKRSVSIYETSRGLDQPTVATALESLAELYVARGDYCQADSLLSRALGILERAFGSKHPRVASFQAYLADIYRRQGKLLEAQELFERALAMSREVFGISHPEVAHCLELLSRCHRLQNHPDRALESSREAYEIRRMNFAGNSMILSERDALRYAKLVRRSANQYLSVVVDQITDGRQVAGNAAEVILTMAGQVSDEILARRRSIVAEDDPVTLALADSLSLAKFCLSQLFVAGPGDDTAGAYLQELDSLREVVGRLESALARLSASFRSQQQSQVVGVDQVVFSLPRKTVLIKYLEYDYQELQPGSTEPRYLAVVIGENDETVIIDLGSASDIRPLVNQYRKHMLAVSSASRMPTVVDRHKYKEISEELYTRVWHPIEKYVPDKDLVLIGPDGALNMVSFAGLMDGDGKYLIEKHAIHYLSAGRDVIRFKQEVEPGSGLFALGDPDFDATALARLSIPEGTSPDSLPEPDLYAVRNIRSGCGELKDITVNPLPFTRSEVETTATRWKESTDEPVAVYFGSDASEEKFKAEAPGKRVIHLATHGYFLEGTCQPDIPKKGFDSDFGFVGENPLLLSGLFFAGANLHGEGADKVEAEDGILTAYEVSSMDLEGAELVVLSACETGLGEVKEGEGVYGLRRAFQIAGARTVISALWPVSDKVTADMMSRLYDRKGESLPETIRRIQLKSINELRSRNKADHPFSWGAFIALGDWR